MVDRGSGSHPKVGDSRIGWRWQHRLFRKRETRGRGERHDADDTSECVRRLNRSVRAPHRVRTAVDAPHGPKADDYENQYSDDPPHGRTLPRVLAAGCHAVAAPRARLRRVASALVLIVHSRNRSGMGCSSDDETRGRNAARSSLECRARTSPALTSASLHARCARTCHN